MAMPAWERLLHYRLDAARKRCTVPSTPQYCDYGGRGIEFRFASVAEARRYCIDELFITAKTLDSTTLDRIDNEGHYERGNIRFVPHSDNNCNRRDSLHWEHEGVRVPNRDALHVVRHLWPEVTYSQNSYRYMYNQYGLRTLQDIKDRFDSGRASPQGGGTRKKLMPPVNMDTVRKYLPRAN